MNILQIVSSSRTSGAEKHVVVLSERLRRRGHTVSAICPPGTWLPDQLRHAGIPTYELKMHGLNACATAMAVTRFARENGIDLIHSHLTRATYLGYLAGRAARLPVVSSVHVITQDLAYRRVFTRQNNLIITVSDYVRDTLIRSGVPAARVRTVYNGTEFCEEAPEADALPVRAELSVPPDAELIGLFAHVGEFKGHPILARAVGQVVAQRPRAYFICVGTVDPVMQKTLWEIAAADGVADRLRFTGIRNDVRRLLAEMDIVTLPSRYEACSMSIIEAMAMGKPVVATRAGGNPELVQDRETGILIERSPEALAAALCEILADTERCRRMGSAAQQRARARFSASIMVQNIEALYQELIARRGAEAAAPG